MIYKNYGNTDIRLSRIGLGGHEFNDDGITKCLIMQTKNAEKPGYKQEGYGGENRKAIVRKALDLGINLFDLTIDPEIEALGRNLNELSVKDEIFIQARPQGMVYTYDNENRKMADYLLLKNEVIRLINLVKRDRIDILNFAFMKNAVDADPDYIDKIGDNIRKLKKEGLIRYASADTFSGNDVYIKQIESQNFDSIYINLNFREKYILDQIVYKAKDNNMAVIGRELFMKGVLFKMALEAGIEDKSFVAKLALKWALNNEDITSVMVGVYDSAQLEDDVSVIENYKMTQDDYAVIEKIFATELFIREYNTHRENFLKEKLL